MPHRIAYIQLSTHLVCSGCQQRTNIPQSTVHFTLGCDVKQHRAYKCTVLLGLVTHKQQTAINACMSQLEQQYYQHMLCACIMRTGHCVWTWYCSGKLKQSEATAGSRALSEAPAVCSGELQQVVYGCCIHAASMLHA
jgi:hypothetical protein